MLCSKVKHDILAAHNSNHVNSGATSTILTQAVTIVIQTLVQRPQPAQVHSSMVRFERPSLGSLSMLSRQQMGLLHGFSCGMNHPGITNLTVVGLFFLPKP